MAYNSPQPVNYQNRKDPNLKTARGLRNESYKKKDQQPKPKTSMGGKAEALKIQLEEKKRLRKITNEIKQVTYIVCLLYYFCFFKLMYAIQVRMYVYYVLDIIYYILYCYV